jgi:hypothetical protein
MDATFNLFSTGLLFSSLCYFIEREEENTEYTRYIQYMDSGAWAIGGFSYLMGIKRRMIDIGKITFKFLQKCWKKDSFSHLHLKFAKSAIMT